MDTLFVPIKFKTTVQLKPNEINLLMDDVIVNKLRTLYEGVCSRFGFVQPKSFELVSRSAGMLLKSHFNGFVRFDVQCRAKVCNPVPGIVLQGIVRNKNQLGLLVETVTQVDDRQVPVLDVIIPHKTAGIHSEVELSSLSIGDLVYYEVLGKRTQLNEKKISVIGRAVTSPDSKKALVAETDMGDDMDEMIDLEDIDPEEMIGGNHDIDLDGGSDLDPNEVDHDQDAQHADLFVNAEDPDDELGGAKKITVPLLGAGSENGSSSDAESDLEDDSDVEDFDDDVAESEVESDGEY